jgi:hypothetical protein
VNDNAEEGATQPKWKKAIVERYLGNESQSEEEISESEEELGMEANLLGSDSDPDL